MVPGHQNIDAYMNYSANQGANFVFSIPGALSEAYISDVFNVRTKMQFGNERAYIGRAEKIAENKIGRQLGKLQRPSFMPHQAWSSWKDDFRFKGMQNFQSGAGIQGFGTTPGHHNTAAYNTYMKNKNKISFAKRRFGIIGGATLGLGLFAAAFEGFRNAAIGQIASNTENEYDNTMPPMLDNVRTHTSRQRALMAIHNSQLHARAVLGNEAQYLHM